MGHRKKKGVTLLPYDDCCRNGWKISLFLQLTISHLHMFPCWPFDQTLTQGRAFPLFSIDQKYTIKHTWDPYLLSQFVQFHLLSKDEAQLLEWLQELHWCMRICEADRNNLKFPLTEAWKKSQWDWCLPNCNHTLYSILSKIHQGLKSQEPKENLIIFLFPVQEWRENRKGPYVFLPECSEVPNLFSKFLLLCWIWAPTQHPSLKFTDKFYIFSRSWRLDVWIPSLQIFFVLCFSFLHLSSELLNMRCIISCCKVLWGFLEYN